MLMRSLIAVLALTFAIATPGLAKDDNTKPLNKGMEKRMEQGKELPPGWKKKLQKGQTLDAEVYAAGKKVTKKQRPEISEPAAGEVWIKISDQLIRIKEANREILEVITAVKRDAKK